MDLGNVNTATLYNLLYSDNEKILWTGEKYYKEKNKKLQMVVCIKKKKNLTPIVTIGPAKSDGLIVVFFSYELIGVTLHNSFKRHYMLAYMKDGQWLYWSVET